jgi:hypothetical protein
MTRHGTLLICLAASFTGVALAQTDDAQRTKTSPPVAYVYVSRPTHIDGFAASSKGELTPVPGSPFLGKVQSMAVSSSLLFGSGADATNVYSFHVASDGALKPAETTNVQTHNSSGCGGLGPPLLDHTGSSLYVGVNTGGSGPGFDCADGSFESFSIEKSTGGLKFLGITGDIFGFFGELSFIGNNRYAYGASCTQETAGVASNLAGFERKSSGDLIFAIDGSTPATKAANSFYCPLASTSNPANHVAVVLQSISNETNEPNGPPELATYSADSHGNLTTKSTFENMPATAVNNISDVEMAPSGKLLVVGGKGFQIFHFNGSSPITKFTGREQSSVQFQQFRWDDADHLYALSGGMLYVYKVTSSGVEQVGSPISIPEAQGLAVLNK